MLTEDKSKNWEHTWEGSHTGHTIQNVYDTQIPFIHRVYYTSVRVKCGYFFILNNSVRAIFKKIRLWMDDYIKYNAEDETKIIAYKIITNTSSLSKELQSLLLLLQNRYLWSELGIYFETIVSYRKSVRTYSFKFLSL